MSSNATPEFPERAVRVALVSAPFGPLGGGWTFEARNRGAKLKKMSFRGPIGSPI